MFLQTWRATIIPVVAIPISLIGTFSILAFLGISINNLSMFGLILAVGIVVDDAIVVVENVERNMAMGMSPKAAAHKTMDEVSGALIAIALTLCAVFVPTVFISGISGLFFTQFAATIAASTIISVIVSLTLSPALCAVLLKPHHHKEPRGLARLTKGVFKHPSIQCFEWLSVTYGKMTARFVRATAIIGLIYLCLIQFDVPDVEDGHRFHSGSGHWLPSRHRLPSPGFELGADRCGRSRSERHHPQDRRETQSFVARGRS